MTVPYAAHAVTRDVTRLVINFTLQKKMKKYLSHCPTVRLLKYLRKKTQLFKYQNEGFC